MTAKVNVLVIGGGIIGAACADELTRRGVAVTIIDKGEIGHGCSQGNAGWLTPCMAMPLPMPGILFKSLKWLLDAESPLYIKPRISWELARWLCRFVKSMTKDQMHRSAEALSELSKFSLDAYRKLDAEFPNAFGFQQRGLLMVARTSIGHEAARSEMELVAQFGIRGRQLDREAIRALEPAVTGADVCGGVFFPDEAHVEPLSTVTALVQRAKARGAQVWPRTEVFELARRGRRVTVVQTTRGPIQADEIVLATGAWSPQFARTLSTRIPILSGKGYAVMIKSFSPSPKIPCMLIEKKVAVTPCDNSMRLAGTLELVGLDESISGRRVNAIIKNSRQYLDIPIEPNVVEVWRGLRPCTPDGVPIIGRPRSLDNVVIATGHQMLGLQTAPATGCLVADLLTGPAPIFDLKPFRVNRF